MRRRRATGIALVLFFTTSVALAQSGEPTILAWTWEGPDNAGTPVEFEWSPDVWAGGQWHLIPGWHLGSDGIYYGLAWLGGHTDLIRIRARIWDGSTWLGSDASNLALPRHCVAAGTCAALDYNRDGTIGLAEFGAIKRWYGQQCSTIDSAP